MKTQTNSSLSTFRRCPREYELNYEQKLVPIERDDEKLIVGSAWHEAHDAYAWGECPYESIAKHAPSPLWIVKLSRMYAAAEWRWKDQPFEIIESECAFDFTDRVDGRRYLGKRDGLVRLPDGREGLLERKTTSDSIEAASSYWDRLRLDTQLTIYAASMDRLPDFILYNVVRKPTINPKRITKLDMDRLLGEFQSDGQIEYFGETFTGADATDALAERHETPELYGARLTADIGKRPGFYFARREVSRTDGDYLATSRDLAGTVDLLDFCSKTGNFPRNPDACNVFGRCRFFGLCSSNEYPTPGIAPDGFRIREHRHPELA